MRAGPAPGSGPACVAPRRLDVAEVVAHRLLRRLGIVRRDAVADAAVHLDHQPPLGAARGTGCGAAPRAASRPSSRAAPGTARCGWPWPARGGTRGRCRTLVSRSWHSLSNATIVSSIRAMSSCVARSAASPRRRPRARAAPRRPCRSPSLLPWTKCRIDSRTVSRRPRRCARRCRSAPRAGPWRASARTASRMTVRETPNCSPSSRSGGSASPGFSWFEAIVSRIASVTLSDSRASRSIALKTLGAVAVRGRLDAPNLARSIRPGTVG